MRARVVPVEDLTDAQVDAWRRLAHEAAEPNPFFEASPVLDAVRLLDGGSGAALAVVEDGDDLLLALPVLRRRHPGRVPVPGLVAWHHPYVHAGVPLLRAGREREAWAELLDHCRHAGHEHWLVLPRLPLHGPASVALHRELATRHLRAATGHVHGRPVLRRRPAETYLDGRLSARSRKTLRRQRRRLADALGGDVVLVDLLAGGSEAALDVFLRLEDSGWKGRAGTALLRRPQDAEWYRRLCRSLEAEGRLEAWALGRPDQAAAAQLNARAGRTVFHLRTAYDERLAAWSPGIQLELEMVRLFHEDVRVDLLDSAVDPGNRVSAHLYPDREVLASVAVPLRLPAGPAAVAAWAAGTRTAAALRERAARRSGP